MHLNEPVHEDASHLLVDVDLLRHVAHFGLVLHLGCLHVAENWL